MGQVHSYFMGTGFGASAELNRDLVEQLLVEEYHWLPQEIAKIPYKWLQRFFLIRKQKRVTLDEKAQIDARKKAAQDKAKVFSRGRGQTKR